MGRRFGTEERNALIRKTAELTADGKSGPEIGAALGISLSTVARYRGLSIERTASSNRALFPVVVETPATDGTPTVSLATPDGFRFEGLDLEVAVRLWKSIR